MGPYCENILEIKRVTLVPQPFQPQQTSHLLGSHRFTALIILTGTENPAADYLKVPFPRLYQSSAFFLRESYHSFKYRSRKN